MGHKQRNAWTLGLASGLVQKLPGGQVINDRLVDAEEFLVDQIADRVGADPQRLLPAPLSVQLQRRMDDLLTQAEDQNLDKAKLSLFESILGQLTPDEVRIIGALSDGNGHAMIHVAAGAPVGPVLRRELANVSNVGRAAGVMWEDMTSYYIQRLRNLGVCETAPEDSELDIKYEVLQGDKRVRETAKRIDKEFGLTARYQRRMLVLSPLGMELWKTCLPEDHR